MKIISTTIIAVLLWCGLALATVNINNGSKQELATLTGIGNSKAQAIIDYRQKHGNFGKKTDLINVKGIGSKIFKKIEEEIEL